MRRTALALGLALAGCHRAPPAEQASAGARLEAAARAAGIVADPAHLSVTGSWAQGTDHLCIVPAADGTTQVGALVDYGDGQGCAALGTLTRHRERLLIRFGACRVEARVDGDRISFPADLPAACERLCTGRATLSALTVDQLSQSASEAATLRTPGGRALCPD